MARKAITFVVIAALALVNTAPYACAQQDIGGLLEAGMKAQKAKQLKKAELAEHQATGRIQ